VQSEWTPNYVFRVSGVLDVFIIYDFQYLRLTQRSTHALFISLHIATSTTASSATELTAAKAAQANHTTCK